MAQVIAESGTPRASRASGGEEFNAARRRVANVVAGDDVNYVLGDVGGMIGDALSS
jgi:hypothetical protein